MITFRCGKCAQPLKATDAAAGKAVKCPRCGHVNVCPTSSAPSDTLRPIGQPATSEEPPPDGPGRLIWIAAGVLLLAGASWMAWTTLDTSSASAETAGLSPADALQQELLHQDIDKTGEPTLGVMFQNVNAQFFGGAIPAMPVMWEPGLARVGPLSGQGFTLEGMFGHINKQSVILLNPALQNDPPALDRALCHEMVHALLWSRGDNSTDHGEAFQTVLASLSKAGAFEGIVATEQERANLRAWLDAESARLDAEGKDITSLGPDLERQKAEVERALADYDTRVRNANGGSGMPSQAEMDAVMKLREEYNKRAADANDRTARGRKDLEHFNAEVARYNLMLVYPDGIDEGARIAPKSAPPRGQ